MHIESHIHIGSFVLEEPVAQGGMGVIWRGRHPGSGILVAVKVLTTDLARETSFRERFEREVRATASLHHPHIVQVYDVGEVPKSAASSSGGRLVQGSPYLAMEFIAGGSLADHCGRLMWPEQRNLFVALLDALGYAHARGVVHRDIKPANVLVPSDAPVRLTDFGLAHLIAVSGEAPERGGTPAYVAPEQLQGRWRDLGPWTDLYAFGCLAWAVVTGQPPFIRESGLQVMQDQLSRKPPVFRPRFPVPPGLEDWLRTLLRKDISRRFRRAADASWALQQLGEPTPLVVDPAGPETQLSVASSHRVGVGVTDLWGEGEWEVQAPEPSASRDDVAAVEHILRPPLPVNWHRPSHSVGLPSGIGLGLYGLRETLLVGREEERDQLWSTFARVARGEGGQIVMLTGPTGSGKSRLARWLIERAHEVGAAKRLRLCADTNPTLRGMVEQYVRCDGLDREETSVRLTKWVGQDQQELVARMLRWLHPEPGDCFSEEESEECVADWLRVLSLRRPVVLNVEMLEGASLGASFVDRFFSRHPKAAVLALVVVSDDRPADRVTQQVLDRISAREMTLHIPLDPLPSMHVAQLLRDLLGLDDALAERVEARCSGNPKFVVQLVGDWVARGLLEPGKTGFQLKEGEGDWLPDELHAVWSGVNSELLEARTGAEREALAVAAVMGQNVHGREWAVVCQRLGVADPLGFASYLVESRQWEPTGSGWLFRHAMLRESIERGLADDGRWVAFHRMAVEVLKERYPLGMGLIAGRLGRHLMEAGEPGQAASLLLSGAKEAIRQCKYSMAGSWLDLRERALDRLEMPEVSAPRLEGWLERVALYLEQGRSRMARSVAERAFAGAQAMGPDLSARAKVRLADASVACGASEGMGRLYREATETLRRVEDWEVLGDAFFGLANLSRRAEDYDQAFSLFRQARGVYAGSEAQYKVAMCVMQLALLAHARGDEEQTSTLAGEALARMEGLGHATGLGRVLLRMGALCRQRGRSEEAVEYVRRALVLFEDLGDPTGQLGCLNELAEIARLQGDLDQAEQGYRRALAAAMSVGRSEQAIVSANLAMVLLSRGLYGHALKRFKTLAETALEMGHRMVEVVAVLGALVAGAALSDAAVVARFLARAERVFVPGMQHEMDVRLLLEEALDRLGRQDSMRLQALLHRKTTDV